MRALTTEVIRHGRITTTLHRAKAIRGEVTNTNTNTNTNTTTNLY